MSDRKAVVDRLSFPFLFFCVSTFVFSHLHTYSTLSLPPSRRQWLFSSVFGPHFTLFVREETSQADERREKGRNRIQVDRMIDALRFHCHSPFPLSLLIDLIYVFHSLNMFVLFSCRSAHSWLPITTNRCLAVAESKLSDSYMLDSEDKMSITCFRRHSTISARSQTSWMENKWLGDSSSTTCSDNQTMIYTDVTTLCYHRPLLIERMSREKEEGYQWHWKKPLPRTEARVRTVSLPSKGIDTSLMPLAWPMSEWIFVQLHGW